MNLSKIKDDKLFEAVSNIKKNTSNKEILNSLSLIEDELKNKKYGLVWEEHEEDIEKELEDKCPIFIEVKDKLKSFEMADIDKNECDELLENGVVAILKIS